MWIKGCLIALLILILFQLFRALSPLLRGDQSTPMSKFLGRRVLLSALLFVVLLLCVAVGIIEPNPRPY